MLELLLESVLVLALLLILKIGVVMVQQFSPALVPTLELVVGPNWGISSKTLVKSREIIMISL
jgi:hypothetical protein